MSSGFVLLLAFLFYLDEGVGLLIPGLLVSVFHELGHIVTIAALGGRVERLELTAVGAALVLDGERPLSYGREAAAAMAGPLASLLWAWGTARLGWYTIAGLSMGAGLFNLLPIYPLDGGRALNALLSRREEGRGKLLVTTLSALLTGLLLGAGWALLRRWGNPTLAITSCWLLAGLLKAPGFQKRGKNQEKILAKHRNLW